MLEIRINFKISNVLFVLRLICLFMFNTEEMLHIKFVWLPDDVHARNILVSVFYIANCLRLAAQISDFRSNSHICWNCKHILLRKACLQYRKASSCRNPISYKCIVYRKQPVSNKIDFLFAPAQSSFMEKLALSIANL